MRILTALCGLLFFFQIASPLLDNKSVGKPFFFSMKWEYENKLKRKNAFSFYNKNTSMQHNVQLLFNSKEQPVLYSSEITTPVCDDTLCKIVNIKIYWNLLGNYVGYDTIAKRPLTKFDHLEFTSGDCAKLHNLLLNKNSILQWKKVADLIDKQTQRTSNVLDVVTGATQLEVKSAVVEGALYSSYTLWHIVHGEVNGKIRSFTQSIYSDSLQNHLLYSDYSDYQLFSMKHLSEEGFKLHFDQIIRIFKKGIPLNRSYIIKHLPEEMWTDFYVQEQLCKPFFLIDRNSRTLLIQTMHNLEKINPKCLEILSDNLQVMSKNQLKFYLEILLHEKNNISKYVISNLGKASRSTTFTYNYLIQEGTKNLKNSNSKN